MSLVNNYQCLYSGKCEEGCRAVFPLSLALLVFNPLGEPLFIMLQSRLKLPSSGHFLILGECFTSIPRTSGGFSCWD